ncbi:ATP-binding protein [uncultured Albimonas sp.]|uniref:ATP-binding protein n=1 Tax=uncultured Albimonas sp. TaxID=1331701 RepID=UPI0030EC83A1|tara:strand:- start:5205 stop:7205 length:2001 start_codon:yes stop_codon:yes gene_type:complete
MSNVNVKRAVENIRSGTNIYTPLVETIVNAIQAIEASSSKTGRVDILVKRSSQQELEGSQPPVESFIVIDNGIGFNDENRNSFDTLYSDHKIAHGGKGFGRFTCLKYFDDLLVESVFEHEDGRKKRSFKMGKQTDIIVNESIEDCPDGGIGSRVTMLNVKRAFPDKKIKTIARALVERLLPYFIDADYQCPEIGIAEDDGASRIILNNFVNNQLSAMIQEIPLQNGEIILGSGDKVQSFTVRVFKVYAPRNQKSKISLVADRREVTDTAIHSFVPEFVDEFFEAGSREGEEKDRNYIVKAYVFGPYLDANVSLERGGFEFPKVDDLLHPISQFEIEQAVAQIARDALGDTITARQEKKRAQVRGYVEDSAPWHRSIAEDIDLASMPYNPTPEQIETIFQKEKFSQEVSIRQQVSRMLNETDAQDLNDGLPKILDQISKTSRNDLIHYIALRKHVLTLFGKSFELTGDQKYPSEGAVHDIIFPRKGDSAVTPFEEHNLWIIDERLNFTNFVSSDRPVDGGATERPDLLVFEKPVLFRGDNEASNPITVFEFKKPGRDDFANPSSKEDPVQQIIRYVNNVKKGKFKTPRGRPILVADNTPFYGYVMCEITEKVKEWLEMEKEFTPMPDGGGWFRWFGNNNLYMEVLSWDKVLRDAEMRNGIFFHKLGI